MDDDKIYGAKPTPDKNPLLSKKINLLYQLLTKQQRINQQRLAVTAPMPSRDTQNGTTKPNTQTETQSATISSTSSPQSSTSSSSNIHKAADCDDQALNDAQNGSEKIDNANNDNDNDNDNCDSNDNHVDDINKTQEDETASYFENVAMSLRLPIPITMKQRLLMLNVGDDFSHIWFPMWRKFLSMKRIHNSFVISKKVGKALEMSQKHSNPKVFVSHEHQNCIFIGPYGNTDPQNLCLFVKHEDHMMLATVYYKKFNAKYTKKTKGEHKNDSNLSDQAYALLCFALVWILFHFILLT